MCIKTTSEGWDGMRTGTQFGDLSGGEDESRVYKLWDFKLL